MPHFVIKTLPFRTRVTHGARNILAADQDPRKEVDGGPPSPRSRDSDTTTDPQISAAAGDASIDATDAGVSSETSGFDDVDGILGIGPVDLTRGTVGSTTSIPTVTDNLFKQGPIPLESIGISYIPSTSATNAADGELTFGGTDSSKFTGDIQYVPITQTSPASNYWGIDQAITYGTGTPILSLTAGIASVVDTGTTLLLIATDAFQAYQRATGATVDRTTGLLTITDEQLDQLQSLFFQISSTYEHSSKLMNSPPTRKSGLIWEAIAGSGLDFIDGFGFLQRFYSVYDTTNSQVGFATTEFTNATTN
ncbi:aspartic peptidase domain-containing protein [Mycena rebaudengoi]|nr:aspartic peptidase domain-containing protein [Mycena rebaudengoi]